MDRRSEATTVYFRSTKTNSLLLVTSLITDLEGLMVGVWRTSRAWSGI